jgi:MFS transporter, ACS family, allantoate permease
MLCQVLVGAVFFVVIPDSQLNARWLDKRERLLAIERVKTNEQGIGNTHFKWYQLKEALLDPHFWALFMYGVLSDIPSTCEESACSDSHDLTSRNRRRTHQFL